MHIPLTSAKRPKLPVNGTATRGPDGGASATGTGWPIPQQSPSSFPPVAAGARRSSGRPASADGAGPELTLDRPADGAGLAAPQSRDRSGTWLRNAAVGLALLAGASAAVSFAAQYRMVYAVRRLALVAGLEAAIPDTAALVFACLGIALALRGRRAIRARVLNVAAVGTSVFMNTIAAAPGWRSLAIWAMPPVAYALASDTLISVVRTAAGRRAGLAEDDATPLAIVGGLVLWLLRLALAPASTLTGFRYWVLAECPVAPGRRAVPVPAEASDPAEPDSPPSTPPSMNRDMRLPARRRGTKTARFLSLVEQRHGQLASIPLASVARICADLAPKADLDRGAARTALRRAVLSAQNTKESSR